MATKYATGSGNWSTTATWVTRAAIVAYNGSTQYATVADSAGTDPGTSDFCFSVKFKSSNTPGSFTNIVRKASSSAIGNAQYDGFGVFLMSTGKVQAYFRHTASSDVDTTIDSNSALNNGSEHTVIVYYDRDGNMSMSVDGVTQTATASIAYASAANINLTQGLYLAARKRDGGSVEGFYTGSIGEFIFAKNLTLASPTVWLKTDEGTGTSLADSSGNSNTGTLTGTPTWSTTDTSSSAPTASDAAVLEANVTADAGMTFASLKTTSTYALTGPPVSGGGGSGANLGGGILQ